MNMIHDTSSERAPGHYVGTDDDGDALYLIPAGWSPEGPHWVDADGYAHEGDAPVRRHERELLIISSRDDIATYMQNTRADVDGPLVPVAIDAIQREQHPRYGSDWSAWLAANADRIIIDAIAEARS